MVTEKDKILLKNKKVAKIFNQYFGYITDSLNHGTIIRTYYGSDYSSMP